MTSKQFFALTIIAIYASCVFGQKNSSAGSLAAEKTKPSVAYKHSIGASLFMLVNFSKESADYYLLTYGYQPSEKNRFFAEFNTWKYVEPAYALKYWPVDTNFPDDFAAVEEGAPNYIFEPSLNFGFKF